MVYVDHGNFTWAKTYEISMEIPRNFLKEISVRNACIVKKTKWRTAHILMPHETTISLLL